MEHAHGVKVMESQMVGAGSEEYAWGAMMNRLEAESLAIDA